ncbi:MAG: hypothetical protein H6745_30530 [Deltaproteobacteria bacterium]|nr:hypothetical protein [Deltaproteobacteria bacterium]
MRIVGRAEVDDALVDHHVTFLRGLCVGSDAMAPLEARHAEDVPRLAPGKNGRLGGFLEPRLTAPAIDAVDRQRGGWRAPPLTERLQIAADK